MKTATLTFHAPNNNGSFFQAFALQKVLKEKFKVDNEIIDFYTKRQEQQYSVIREMHSVGDMFRNLISILHYRDLKDRHRRFDVMRKEFLNMSKRCTKEQEVYQMIDKYETIICGSDQIWNTEARDFSEAYFLPHKECRKITYAVSCGSHINSINKEYVQTFAKEFAHISVREKTTQSLLLDSGLEEIEIVLDPTFLLKKQDYDCLYEKESIIKKPYIFLYTINYNDEILKTVSKLALELSMPVYTPFTGYSAIKCRQYGIKVLYDVAPDKFLNLVENAEYVCSNSFHGIAFSIIFEKKFFRLCSTDSEGNGLRDDRIDGILDALGLQGRNISIAEEQYSEKNKVIDYMQVEERIKALQVTSLQFLEKALSV